MATTVTIDGLTFNSEPGDGEQWKLMDLEGWYSSPTVTAQISDAPLQDGAFGPARTYRGSKALSLVGVTYGQGAAGAIQNAWQAIAAISTTGQAMDLEVTDELDTKRMTVWLSGAPQVQPFAPGRAMFQVPLVAADPRKYGTTKSAFIQAGGFGTDGLHFPMGDPTTGPLNFGTFTPSGIVYAENDGTATTYPTFTVSGSLSSAGFSIISEGSTITYVAAVAQGATVTLSPFAGGRAVASDGSDVTPYLTRIEWPTLAPGQRRAFQFTALGSAGSTSGLTVTVSDAYW